VLVVELLPPVIALHALRPAVTGVTLSLVNHGNHHLTQSAAIALLLPHRPAPDPNTQHPYKLGLIKTFYCNYTERIINCIV